MENEINISEMLTDIANNGDSVIQFDRGNGCAGPMMCDSDDVREMAEADDFDNITAIDDLDDDVLEMAEDACECFRSSLSDFTHVISRSDDNGWTGYWLVW